MPFRRQQRNAHRWRLWICADYVRHLSGCLRTFARPVEASTPPRRALVRMSLGGGEGNRTPVQNASRLPELQPWLELWGWGSAFSSMTPQQSGVRATQVCQQLVRTDYCSHSTIGY